MLDVSCLFFVSFEFHMKYLYGEEKLRPKTVTGLHDKYPRQHSQAIINLVNGLVSVLLVIIDILLVFCCNMCII